MNIILIYINRSDWKWALNHIFVKLNGFFWICFYVIYLLFSLIYWEVFVRGLLAFFRDFGFFYSERWIFQEENG